MISQDDFVDTVSGLNRSIGAIKGRLKEIGVREGSLRKERAKVLDAGSRQLIPQIHGAVLASLRLQVPGYVDEAVTSAFRRKSKWLGFITPPGYAATLQALRTRLASHLDRSGWGEIRAIDSELQQLAAERAELGARAHDLEALLAKLGNGQPVAVLDEATERVFADVAKVVRAVKEAPGQGKEGRPAGGPPGRTGRGAALGAVASLAASSSPHQHAGDGFGDLWLYAFTDIPSSARTLLMSAVQHSHRQHETHIESAGLANRGDSLGNVGAPDLGNAAAHGGGVDQVEMTVSSLAAQSASVPSAQDSEYACRSPSDTGAGDQLGYFS